MNQGKQGTLNFDTTTVTYEKHTAYEDSNMIVLK